MGHKDYNHLGAYIAGAQNFTCANIIISCESKLQRINLSSHLSISEHR